MRGAVEPILDGGQGEGHCNLARGIVGTLQGIGATLPFAVAGFVVQKIGLDAADLTCGLVALAALVLLWARMPETCDGMR